MPPGLSGNIVAISEKIRFWSSAVRLTTAKSTMTAHDPIAASDGPTCAKIATGTTSAMATPSFHESCRANSDFWVALPTSDTITLLRSVQEGKHVRYALHLQAL